MPSPLRTVWTVAANELADSIRSRRVIVLVLLYLAGSVAGTAIFISVIQKVEHQLVQSLGIAAVKTTGSVTATLWKSEGFRQTLIHLVGDRELAVRLLDIPPLALFYGWLSFAFAPALVMLTSSTRISEEISTGSIRFVLFRASRLQWCAGKVLGQAGQLLAALLLSAVGAWLTGLLRMESFQPLPTAIAMLAFVGKAWVYSMAFLGLATAISELCAAPNVALAFGFMSLIGMSIITAVSERFAGDGVRRMWDLLNALTPGSHSMDMWWGDAAHAVPAVTFLLSLGVVYVMAGYARFSRRDL